ncbi:MAG: sulfate ABC transporter permease, partial [Clostridia bacterium]
MKESKNPGKWVLIGLCAAFILLFLLLPLVFVLVQAFKDGLAHYLANISDPYAIKALGLTLKTTAVAVAVNTVFGLAAAWTVTKFSFRGKKVLTTFIDLPLSISPVIAGLIYILTFGRSSPIYGFLMAHDMAIVYAVPGVMLATIFTT